MQTEVAPAKVRLSDELGQLPPTRYVLGKEGDGYSEDRLLDEPAWAEENMRAYGAGQVAAERERCNALGALALEYAKDADWSRAGAVLGFISHPPSTR